MINGTRHATLVYDYDNQLSRFHSNSMAAEVLICLILIFILVIEIIKFVKKTYEWQTELEVNLDKKYEPVEESKFHLGREAVTDNNNKNEPKRQMKTAMQEERPSETQRRAERLRKDVYVPAVVKVQEILKNKLPQLAVIAVNIVMLSTYQFLTISAYIAIVLIAISEILGLTQSEHLTLRLVLDVLAKMLIAGWYINLLTTSKPSPI